LILAFVFLGIRCLYTYRAKLFTSWTIFFFSKFNRKNCKAGGCCVLWAGRVPPTSSVAKKAVAL
jgi:hypothetical protein